MIESDRGVLDEVTEPEIIAWIESPTPYSNGSYITRLVPRRTRSGATPALMTRKIYLLDLVLGSFSKQAQAQKMYVYCTRYSGSNHNATSVKFFESINLIFRKNQIFRCAIVKGVHTKQEMDSDNTFRFYITSSQFVKKSALFLI